MSMFLQEGSNKKVEGKKIQGSKVLEKYIAGLLNIGLL